MSSTGAAIDLLVARALGNGRRHRAEAVDVHAAALLLRSSIDDLSSTQAALTEALIASQDRLFAVTTLAQVNDHGAGGDEPLRLLLDQALVLAEASQVLVIEDGSVSATRGDPDTLALHTEIALRAIAESPRAHLLTAAAHTAMIGTIDPAGGVERRVAFFRPPDHPFSTTDIPLVEAINAALGVRLAFTELYQRELEQAVVEHEHRLASALAQSVTAGEPPRSATIDIFASTVPASLAGGDFYVFGQSDGCIWFAVGDVAGKGLPAAMLMTRAVAACRVAFLAGREESVETVFARIEDELFEHFDDAGLFLTLAMGRIEEASGRVTMVNAAHSPVLLVRHGAIEPVRSSVPPLGVMRQRIPKTCTFTLEDGTSLFLGSDGLAEQTAPNGEMFGYDNFYELCRASSALSSATIGNLVFETVRSFAAGTPPSDDATLVVVASAGGSR